MVAPTAIPSDDFSSQIPPALISPIVVRSVADTLPSMEETYSPETQKLNSKKFSSTDLITSQNLTPQIKVDSNFFGAKKNLSNSNYCTEPSLHKEPKKKNHEKNINNDKISDSNANFLNDIKSIPHDVTSCSLVFKAGWETCNRISMVEYKNLLFQLCYNLQI